MGNVESIKSMASDSLTREITDALLAYRAGDKEAQDSLFSLSYPKLRRIASRQLGPGRQGATLNTTGLVHEAYLKLVDQSRVQYADRVHFFAVMARAMRQIVVDHARRRAAAKRGGGVAPLELNESQAGFAIDLAWVLGLDQALRQLGEIDPRMERVVDCRFFCGYTETETAEALDMSVRSVQRTWQRARGWLKRELATAG